MRLSRSKSNVFGQVRSILKKPTIDIDIDKKAKVTFAIKDDRDVSQQWYNTQKTMPIFSDNGKKSKRRFNDGFSSQDDDSSSNMTDT
jgi:hypothetical protein